MANPFDNVMAQYGPNAANGGARYGVGQQQGTPNMSRASYGNQWGVPSYGSWMGAAGYENNAQRMNTPFDTQLTKDALGGHGSNLSGAMGQLGGGLQNAANAQSQARMGTMPFTQATKTVPMGVDQGSFQNWLDNNSRWQNSQLAQQKNAFNQGLGQNNQQFEQQRAQNNTNAAERFNYELPYQQRLMGSLFGGLGSMNGGGFNSNFGAAGSYQ